MNILVISDNDMIITRLKEIFQAHKDEYHLLYKTDTYHINKELSDVEWVDFVILDSTHLELVKRGDIDLNSEYAVQYPTLLIMEESYPADIKILQKFKISLIQSLSTCGDYFIIQLQLIYHNFQKTQRIRYHALRDPLTQLFNRNMLMSSLKQHIHLFHQYNISFCLGMIDLDCFKNINDNFGHLKGDEVLQKLSNIMQKNTRKTDVVARMGGEEFAILFPETTLDIAYAVMERIRKEVKESVVINDSQYVTLSGGVVMVDSHHKSYEDLIRESDLLLYQSKEQGRNQISK